MQMNPRTTQFAYFGIPAFAFIGVRLFLGGPQAVHASDILDIESPTALPTEVVIPVQTDERSTADVITGIQRNLSPFWYDGQLEVESPLIEEIAVFKPDEPGAPSIHVTTIMPHPTRPLAVINGKPREIGDSVAPGWRLSGIDGKTRTVTITNPDGEEYVMEISKQ
jgi:hypothetical protein